MNEKTIKSMKESLKIQGTDGNWNYNEYMLGMYNGMELMLAIAEGRDPEYKKRPSNFHKLIEFDTVITNGYIDKETISKRAKLGWNFVVTIPAKLIHPSACGTDKATIFAKFTPYPKEEGEVPDIG